MKPIHIMTAKIITTLILLLNVCPVLGTTYYISPAGDDNNNGTSQKEAWATVNKVNETSFLPGDIVLFECGKTFKGPLKLSSDDKGTAADR
jgi:hypothetical protein